MTTALFPGSFDPVTNGHLDTIKQAARVFDRLLVVVMTNSSKKALFTPEERVDLIKDAVKDLDNVEVLARPNQLTVDLARELGAGVLVRGVRNGNDFLYEQQIALLNRELAPDLPTALFMAGAKNIALASSMLKEIALFGGDLERFLPAKAARALKEKLSNET
ncbi:phosphopantetheine adenylyltransferase [Lactobacillus nasalidis]|uniref:Phosphopantetheine adenylyltransferase n=1 Tax=Lactobacillus nasalidis TaxID=2797258 RepID=A0ABQ3W2S2_9LACO|nr:pantetheine-phosphate adenylyltransferase [Lactobacillus nasalidis]GHV97421.1 phosphopantetheine adenylyltransferase [Lactobacillus nasalidis]GHV99987.1 phosphopantetheine adenylyltransferase [Lactobacillus nasalidis]GHW00620.1 phosphopantetheine adenylyltransferase [Lactobacillus nasalidis]